MPTDQTETIITIANAPAHPECNGTKWNIPDEMVLSDTIARILVGRIDHAKTIIDNFNASSPTVTASTKEARYKYLHPSSEQGIYQRDALIFEAMTWIFATITSTEGESVSEPPHPKSTFQGTDGLRVELSSENDEIERVHIHEVKCTESPRDKFRDEVIPGFQKCHDGTNDSEILPKIQVLLERAQVNESLLTRILDRVTAERPFSFHACLTSDVLDEEARLALFKDYGNVLVSLEDRNGHTFELEDIRDWFEQMAQKIWTHIEGWDETCLTQQVNA